MGQPGTLLFFTSRSVIYTSHLKSILNLYLQILRLHFVSMRAKISVIAAHDNKKQKKKNKKIKKQNHIYLFDIFPDFKEFDCSLFTFELFQSYTSNDRHKDDRNKIVRYDGVKDVKFKSVMLIAKKWIAGALDLSVSWNMNVNKVKRFIIVELCNYDTNNERLLAHSLLHIVKKRLCFHLNQLLHSAQHQHVLSGIPAVVFQELLHYNTNNKGNKDINMSLSSKDEKEIKQNSENVLNMNLKLTLAINSLLEQDDFYEKNAKQQINTLIQIINMLSKASK